jgi:cation diffusion facilitator CzcD-associated flavoprotein CzcO
MSRNGSRPETRIAIVGTGFAGLGMAIRLKEAGINDFVVLERADDVGGTWRDNSYPGCQCDVPSHLYSLSFAPNPNWSRTYSRQSEIWDYLRDCADRFGIQPHIRYGWDLQDAAWDERAGHWVLKGPQGELTARILIAGVGPLSEPSLPDVPGLDRFEGKMFHSARWDHVHDLTGERVASIGTGASAIQYVPRIQPKVGKLHVFQRTPPWVLPHTDRPITGLERWLYRRVPALQRAVRAGIYWARETVVVGMLNRRLIWPAQLLARLHLRRQVRDRELRRKVTPSYTIGCKRILPSNSWYPALTKPNVELVTEGIREVRPRSIVTADGTEREVDTIILGTGFHVTDLPAADHVRGREGRTLAESWQGSPQAYLGTTIAGFPNLFMLLGPNTGLGHTSVVFMVEAQMAHVMDAVRTMDEQELDTIEVRPQAQAAFNRRVQERMPGTVWTAGGCASWYIDRNGLNTTLWPGFTWDFRLRARRFREADYVLGPRTPAPAAIPLAAGAQ